MNSYVNSYKIEPIQQPPSIELTTWQGYKQNNTATTTAPAALPILQKAPAWPAKCQ